jgi:hypothetical protein
MAEVTPDQANSIWNGGLVGLIILCVLVAFGMWGCPKYKAWAHVTNAKAEAEADIIRARGLRESQQIVEAPCPCEKDPAAAAGKVEL